MKVLVAYEFSGVVRDAFRNQGHYAFSCDILPCINDSGFHFKGDVRALLNQKWDLMIAHPPCTYLCNSGVRWLQTDKDRWEKLREAMVFFYQLLNAPIPKIAVENPIPHKYALLPKYSQVIQPYMFVHKERKATCLWLKNLPPLIETNNVFDEMKKLPKKEQQRIHYMSPGKERGMHRSVTFKGIADAMAKQWGSHD